MNTAQKLASSKPDRDMGSLPKSRGGWKMIILIAAIALFFYWKPNAITSTFADLKAWILTQQKQIFSQGGGYGELPKSAH